MVDLDSDEEIGADVYFVNAPGCKTRREAEAKFKRDHQFAEPVPLTDVKGKILHQIYQPFCDYTVTNRLVVATPDRKVHKAIRIGKSDLKLEKTLLDLAKAGTTVPVPQVYSYKTTQEFEILVLEQLDGDTLENVWPTLSETEKLDIADQVAALVQELQKVTATQALTTRASGQRSLKAGIRTVEEFELERFAPFLNDERVAEFIKSKTSQMPDEPFVLTHGDLDWSNILVTDKKVSGLLDFEGGGLLPKSQEWVRVKQWRSEWIYLLDHRMQHLEEPGWEGMLELEKLFNAFKLYSMSGLDSEMRRDQRSRGWKEVTRILGDDGRQPPYVNYADDDMDDHPWVLRRIKHKQ